MNDKVKLFVLAGIFFLAITGFYFLLMRNAGQTDSSQIEKAAVSQGGKTVKKTEISKDADLHEIPAIKAKVRNKLTTEIDNFPLES